MSSVLAPISSGRRVLAPISPSKKKRTALGALGSSFANRQNQMLSNNHGGKGGFGKSEGFKTAPSPKRPLGCLDENALALRAGALCAKRFKSFTSCDGKSSSSSSGVSNNSAPRFVLVTDENATVNAKKTTSSKPVLAATLSSKVSGNGGAAAKPEKARAPLSIHKQQQQQSSATSNNSNATTYSFATRGSDGNMIRKSKKASGSSPIRDRDGARGVKRTHARFEELKNKNNNSNVRRVDPPTSNKDVSSSPTGSIDEVLSGKVSDGTSIDSQKSRSIAYPVSPVSRSSTTNSTKSAPLFPDSWMFKIHEDTEEETLTNIVEFHAGNLDISDDEGGRVLSELEIKGKENIPPADDESYSVPTTVTAAATADRIAMPPPAAKPAPVDHKSASVGRPRSPLSSIPTSELYPESSSSSSENKEEKKDNEKKKEDVEMAGGSQ